METRITIRLIVGGQPLFESSSATFVEAEEESGNRLLASFSNVQEGLAWPIPLLSADTPSFLPLFAGAF